LELAASAGMYRHINGAHARVPLGAFKIGRIAQDRRPHLTNDVRNDPRIGDPVWARREGMVAFSGYPLLIEERVMGVMALFARRALSPETLDLLAAVAPIVAQGIDRKRVEAAAREKAEFLQRLMDSSQDCIKVLDLEGRLLFMNNSGQCLLELEDFGSVSH